MFTTRLDEIFEFMRRLLDDTDPAIKEEFSQKGLEALQKEKSESSTFDFLNLLFIDAVFSAQAQGTTSFVEGVDPSIRGMVSAEDVAEAHSVVRQCGKDKFSYVNPVDHYED